MTNTPSLPELEIDRERRAVLAKFSQLVNDEKFDRIELALRDTNIFAVLGIEHMEVRHSNFLAWLLDPEGTHDLGPIFIKRFLRDIFLRDDPSSINQIDIYDASSARVKVRREWQNIDILLITEELVVCIENKVDTSDSIGQLARYREIVKSNFPTRRRAFVYLTPDGREPIDKSERDVYINYSYCDIVDHISRILSLHKKSMIPSVGIYINDYLTNIRRNIMKESEPNTLAQQLYETHKEVLDFIYENRPDVATSVCDYLRDKVEDENWKPGSHNKGYVRFLTDRLNDVVPKNVVGTSWTEKEQFLFEFQLSEQSGLVTIHFATVISEWAKSEAGSIIREAIDRVDDDAKRDKIKDSRWFTQIRLTINAKDAPADQEAAKKSIDDQWLRVKSIVEKVETAVMSDADRLKSLMSAPGD